MGSLIMNLMKVASDESVTQITHITPDKVTPKPAWIKAVTQITHVTHDFDKGNEEGENLAYIRRVDALIQKGVINRQEGLDLVNQSMYYPDIAESKLHRLEVDSRMSKYYRHHFSCKKCVAAGLGYGTRCDAGLTLWEEKP